MLVCQDINAARVEFSINVSKWMRARVCIITYVL